MLEGLLHHKKEEKDYLATLVVTDDRIDAAVWETTSDAKVTVLDTAKENYSGEWEKAIDAADKAISAVEQKVPEGKELKKVVFGLFPEYVTDDRIKDGYLKKLKQLTAALSLTAVGFVELPNAIAHLLSRDEGTQQTVILVGIETKTLTVSVFKIGKLIGSVTSDRSKDVAVDLEKALTSFTNVEVLPSRILIYGTSADLEQVKNDFLNYPWQKKANFIHFPKIETLADDFTVKAVSIASSTEIIPHQPEETAVIAKPEDGEPGQTEKKETAVEQDEVEKVAQDLGFVTEKEDARAASEPETGVDLEETSDSTEVTNIQPAAAPIRFKKPILPKINLPKISFTIRWPRLPKIVLIIGVVLILCVVIGGYWGANWWLPHASIKVLVSPQTMDKTEQISIDPQATSVDVDKKILPSKEVSTEISGSETMSATGKKTVGEKAKGEIIIYNKTANPKTFKKGTIISVGKLQFVLDDDVEIAAASESVGSLTYGSNKTAVTAVDIGTASNVAPATDFAFAELPTNLYSARNEKAFSGGSSKEITIVSRDDQKQLHDQALNKLAKDAVAKLQGQVSTEEKILDKSETSKVISEKYNKEIGEEASEVTLDMTLSITALAYNQKDFDQLVEQIATQGVTEGYEYKKEDVKLSVEDVAETKDKIRVFTTHIVLNLLPKIETQDLTKNLSGKTINEATEYLKQQKNISGVEIAIDAPLGLSKNSLPSNPANITIEVKSL